MRFAFSFFVVLLALSVSAVAGEDAFFSKDGESVTFISHNGTDLLRLHLKTRKVAKVNLGAEFKGQQLGPLCGGADGETLFVTAKGVFVHDAKGTRPLVTQPLAESLNIRSVFAAPATQAKIGDWLFVAANREAKGSDVIYYARKPGEKGFQPLFCRRTSEVESGVFTEDGRFFFAGNYDLWEGGFEADEEGTANIATLVGTRIAPLGVLNTDSANGGSLRVAQIMIAGKFLYVRLDGRHMGELVRLPMPKAQAPTAEGVTDNNDTQRQYAQMSKTLATAQSVPTDGAEVTTAAATLADGVEKLFYRAADNDGKLGLYLWENATGKPQQIAEEPR